MVLNGEHNEVPFWVVVHVWDGDTIDFRSIHGETVRVRLWGLDAPEHGQMGFRGSRRALITLLEKQPLSVQVVAMDKYGRAVAKVRNGERCLVNEIMIRDGWAWWYRRYCKRELRLAALEHEARKERRGIWQWSGNVEPWLWRRGITEKREGCRGAFLKAPRR